MKKKIRLLAIMLVVILVTTCSFSVLTAFAASYSLKSKTATVYTGNTYTVQLLNSSGTRVTSGVTYSSSNTTVATVSTAGVVSAKSPGTAKITVKKSGVSYVCTVTVYLNKVTGIAAQREYKNNILTWNAVTGSIGYRIYRSSSSTGSLTYLGSTASNVLTFTDSTAVPGTTYYYSVYGTYMSGNTLKCGLAPTRLKVVSASYPSKVTGIAAEILYKQNVLTWNEVIGTIGYRVYRSATANGALTYLGSTDVNTLTYKDNAIELGETYYYKVYATYMNGSNLRVGAAPTALKVVSLDEDPAVLGTSVLLLGAKGDGSTDDTAAFSTTLADDALFVPAGEYKITSDITFDVPLVFAHGAKLLLDDGVTLTFNEELDAGLTQIIEGGNIVLNKNSVSYPEWFGADNTGVTDSTKAIQQAINCFPNGYGKVIFSAGKYTTTNTITISAKQSHLTLEGTSNQTRESAPQIVIKSTSKTCLHLLGNSSGGTYDGGLEDVTITNMEFSRSSMGSSGSDTVLVENTLYATFENVGVSKSQNGFRCVNTNGTRFYSVHCTTGGDLSGKEVRGIYIDGTKKGSTGVLIDDFIYYGYGSPNSTTIAYKDVNSGVSGDSTGDRRIKNFECSGSVDYGIYISSSGGFAGDVSIMEMSMDGVDKCGIYIKANNPYSWQQANITNVYLRLGNSSGNASAINVENYANVHIDNLHVDNASGNNNGVVIKNSSGSTIASSSFGAQTYRSAVSITNSDTVTVMGCTSSSGGSFNITGCENSIVMANSMPNISITDSNNTNCLILNNIFSNTSLTLEASMLTASDASGEDSETTE